MKRLLACAENEEIVSYALGALETFITNDTQLREIIFKKKIVQNINEIVWEKDFGDKILKKASNFLEKLFRAKPRCDLQSVSFLYPTILKFLDHEGLDFRCFFNLIIL